MRLFPSRWLLPALLAIAPFADRAQTDSVGIATDASAIPDVTG